MRICAAVHAAQPDQLRRRHDEQRPGGGRRQRDEDERRRTKGRRGEEMRREEQHSVCGDVTRKNRGNGSAPETRASPGTEPVTDDDDDDDDQLSARLVQTTESYKEFRSGPLSSEGPQCAQRVESILVLFARGSDVNLQPRYAAMQGIGISLPTP
ncbi:hypothetical protein F2P81_011130 [Scophthalmus maximus]|uniref:Uncharacterized protein n=1 Tax=Scophthalmus maximus TaxID=52904 RepID=A0A6A4SUM4_SCOMX|nr:hypothetical protein F2P81_011130 [Scophthalmus maximus]